LGFLKAPGDFVLQRCALFSVFSSLNVHSLFFLFRALPAWEAKKNIAEEKSALLGDVVEKIYQGVVSSPWEAAKLPECVALGITRQSIDKRLRTTHPFFIPLNKGEGKKIHREVIDIGKIELIIDAKAKSSEEAKALLSRSRISADRRRTADEALRKLETVAAEKAAAAQAKHQNELILKLEARCSEAALEVERVKASHEASMVEMEGRLAAAQASGAAYLLKQACEDERVHAVHEASMVEMEGRIATAQAASAKTTAALKLSVRKLKSAANRRDAHELRSSVSATVETGDSVEVATLKTKLSEARQKLRVANKNKGRVAGQSKTMAGKCKIYKATVRRVDHLQEAGEADAIAEKETSSREGEYYSMARDWSKRGAPYDQSFECLYAPAMMASGASGNVIAEVLRKHTLLYFLPPSLFFRYHWS